ncbi:MAG: hypothetical protein H6816_09270 [Phycisphaerales bacterium]|nr:hypothetical protein [Phycisphaerales bacterium]
MNTRLVGLLAAVGAAALPCWAKNVDLSTIPPRDTVQLTIYNSEDLTLVRETRRVTFKQGINPLQFSWANTLIDPTSVDLRFKSHAGELELLDTTFPHDKPQMLYWAVRSAFDGDAEIEVTYFTSGISWAVDYVCVSDPAEETMAFDGFVRVINNSGEDYAGAQVRMVVGTISLVEKVRELAQRGIVSEVDRYMYEKSEMRARDFDAAARKEVCDELQMGMARGAVAAAPKEIVKEGLSEYFIFTVEGTETVPNGWSKRMRLFAGKAVPFHIQYRYRPQEYGDQLVRMFLLRNDTASDLGSTPLPDGVVRLFRDNCRDGLSFLLAQTIKYVPIGQEIELNLGSDPEVIHERILQRAWRSDFWFRRNGASVYYSPTEGHRIEIKDTVAGWDDHELWIERIRNYRAKPIAVEIRRSFAGDVVFRSDLAPTLYDYRSPQFTAQVAPAKTANLTYETVTHQGRNKQQDHVTLEERQ